MKDTFYFPHDFNSRGDEKILLLLRKHGWAGYGLYWALIEKLYEAGGKIKPDFETMAYDLRSDPGVMQSIVEEFDLFFYSSSVSDNALIGSRSVDRRLNERRESFKKKSEMGSRAAAARWDKSNDEKNAERMRSACGAHAERCQERKGKERKEKKEKTIAPSAASPEIDVPLKPKELSPIQIVVGAYKIAKGNERDDKAWDRANFARYSKSAKSLLECFGSDDKSAVVYLLGRGQEMDDKGLDWTLETIARHAWDNKGKLTEANGKQHREMGADRLLGQDRSKRVTPSGELAAVALRSIENKGREATGLAGPPIYRGDGTENGPVTVLDAEYGRGDEGFSDEEF